MPRRPRIACLLGSINLFTSSLVLCLLTSVYQSVVTSWRPTRLTSGCNHAQKGSPVPPDGLVYTTYGWMRGVHAASGRDRAGSVRTVCSGTVPTLGRIAARLHIDNWLTLGPYKSGDSVLPHVHVACVCWSRGQPALCMYCMRQSVWPKPGPRHATRLTRAASSWGASGPAAHVWLRYMHVATPPKRRGWPANALRFTI
jgi:hypothetical protein